MVANYLLGRCKEIKRTQNNQLFKDAVSRNDINTVKNSLKNVSAKVLRY